MDWSFITLIAVLVILVILIFVFLVSLLNEGDERYEYIKTKAMRDSFISTAGALVIRVCFKSLIPAIKATTPQLI